jgi:hypothetical protein
VSLTSVGKKFWIVCGYMVFTVTVALADTSPSASVPVGMSMVNSSAPTNEPSLLSSAITTRQSRAPTIILADSSVGSGVSLPAHTFPTYVKFRGDPDNHGTLSNQARIDIPASAPFNSEGPFFAVGFFMPLDYGTWGIVFGFGDVTNYYRGMIAASTNPPNDFVNLFEWNFDYGTTWKNLAMAPVQSPAMGAWSHIAIALKSTTDRNIYQDGLISGPATSDVYNSSPRGSWPSTIENPLSFVFGSYAKIGGSASDAHSFNGGMRNWAIVTGTPTEAELARHRNSESAVSIWGAARVWAEWRFTANPGLGQKEPDISGHGRDLTYYDNGSGSGHTLPTLVTSRP